VKLPSKAPIERDDRTSAGGDHHASAGDLRLPDPAKIRRVEAADLFRTALHAALALRHCTSAGSPTEGEETFALDGYNLSRLASPR
jgi:hypothetical protein